MESQQSHDIKSELIAGLALHTGSTCWFRHWTARFIYTEGVQSLADKASAYWLTTAVADNGNGRELARKDTPWTDFPLDNVSLHLADNTLLLPSEHQA
jgi:hypothetical protein